MTRLSRFVQSPAAFVVLLLLVVSGAGVVIRVWPAAPPPVLPCAEPALVGEWLSCEGGPAGAGPREWLAGRPLDVNRATATELAEIPGIGEGLARAIVAHRERQGPFATLDALTEVRGIGLRTLERARPYLHAGGAPRMPHTSSPDDMPR